MHQAKIWDYFQNNPEVADTAFKADSRYCFIARQITHGASVLNIGVGKGGLEKILLDKNVKVHALDPNEDTIKDLNERLNLGKKARVGFSQSIPFNDECFDVVIMSEVLEHLPNDMLEKTLKECRRVLRAGGRFIGTVPADENLMESKVICPECGKSFHRWGHVQSFSKIRIKAVLSKEFNVSTVQRKYFGNWKTLNVKGRVNWVFKQISFLLGAKGDGDTFFFSGIK